MAVILVERRFAEPVEFQELQEHEDRFAWCLETHRVRFIRSYFSNDRRTMFCEYEAPDAEAVRSVQRTAVMPHERVVAVTRIEWSQET